MKLKVFSSVCLETYLLSLEALVRASCVRLSKTLFLWTSSTSASPLVAAKMGAMVRILAKGMCRKRKRMLNDDAVEQDRLVSSSKKTGD